MYCPNCDKEFDSKFCPDCGTKLVERVIMWCPNCGLETDSKFCPECGTKIVRKDAGAHSKNTDSNKTYNVILEEVGRDDSTGCTDFLVLKTLGKELNLDRTKSVHLAHSVPTCIKEAVSLNEAESWKKKLEESGARIRIRIIENEKDSAETERKPHEEESEKKQQYKYHPKDKDKLMELVEKLIEERGEDADLNDIDTSEITNMSGLFLYEGFNGDISKWDVSNVQDMSNMFESSDFNGDISKWDVSKVEDMSSMFDDCPLENNPPKWYNK